MSTLQSFEGQFYSCFGYGHDFCTVQHFKILMNLLKIQACTETIEC